MAIQRGQLLVAPAGSVELLPEIAALPLDAGEKEAIGRARSEPGGLVLLDDRLAREAARAHGLIVKGTLGVIVQAYRERLVPLDETGWLIEAIMADDRIWIADGLCRQVLAGLRAHGRRPG